MAQLLWVTADYFEPVDNGRRRYSAGIADGLAQRGHSIHFLGRHRSTGTGIADADWTLLPARHPPTVRKVLSRRPATAVEVWDHELDDELRRLAAHCDAVVLDHLGTEHALGSLPSRRPVVYLSHGGADEPAPPVGASGLRRAALALDHHRSRRSEHHLVEKSEVISAISADDAERYRRQDPPGVVVRTPPIHVGARLAERTIDVATPRRVVIISSWFGDAKANIMNLTVEGLAPLIDDNIELDVFTDGHRPGRDLAAAHPMVRFHRFGPDLDAVLAEARIGIVHEPIVGGFRMQALDLLFRRVPMISAAGSITGLPLEGGISIVEVGSHTELVGAVSRLIDDLDTLNAMHELAYDTCRTLFTVDSVTDLSEAISQAVNSVRNRRFAPSNG